MSKFIKRVPDFYHTDIFSMVEVKDIPHGLKVHQLIDFLKTCNPDAIILMEYDGSIYSPGLPSKKELKETWDPTKYTSEHYSLKRGEDGEELIVTDGTESAVKFE